MEQKILKPTNDIIFKEIFGNINNSDILASFLSAILGLPIEEYSSLTIVDPHLRRDGVDDKLGILDIKLHTKTGTIIDIEVQLLDTHHMRDRIVFYTSKMITEQLSKGADYKLKKVVSIIITDFVLIKENEEYHNRYQLTDLKTGSIFSDKMEIDSLELPKLPATSDNTELWSWLKFLKSREQEEFDMLAQKSPVIEKAVCVLKELSQDERTRLLYEAQEKADRDRIDLYSKAHEEGIETEKYETVKTAFKLGLPIEQIAQLTRLDHDRIQNILSELRSNQDKE